MPEIERFSGVDPIASKFPHVNPYNYAENSPIVNIDLWGLQAENFMSKFKQPGDLKMKLPDMKKAQIQIYITTVNDPKVSFKEIKTLFLKSPQDILSNSKATFNAPVDSKGKSADFEKGSFIGIDIDGPFNDAYVKVHNIEETESSVKATFVTMKGHMEKGIISFEIEESGNSSYSFTISSASEVDMGMAPENFSRKEQRKSWNEVIDNFVKKSKGTEDKSKRVNRTINPKKSEE